MSLKIYLYTIAISTTLCAGALFLVLFNVDPFAANFTGLLFFYLSIWATLVGIFCLLLFVFFYRKKHLLALPVYKIVQKSFVSSLFISALLTTLLFLRGQRLINWLVVLGAIIATICFFLFRQVTNRYKS